MHFSKIPNFYCRLLTRCCCCCCSVLVVVVVLVADAVIVVVVSQNLKVKIATNARRVRNSFVYCVAR